MSRICTALSAFFFCNAPPIRTDISKTPSPAKLADSAILTGPVIVIIFLGLLLLTAGIIYILNNKYGQPAGTPDPPVLQTAQPAPAEPAAEPPAPDRLPE